MAALSALLLIGAGLVWGATQHPRPRSAAAPGAMLVDSTSYPAPAFALRDQQNRLVNPAVLRGHVTLLAFVNPTCTTVCPLLARQLAQVQAALPGSGGPDVVLVSVAPNQSPAQAQAFAAHTGLRPGWRFLLGPANALPATWRAFHVTVQPGAGDVLHDGAVVLLDKAARVRDEFYAPFPTGLLTAEARTLGRS